MRPRAHRSQVGGWRDDAGWGAWSRQVPPCHRINDTNAKAWHHPLWQPAGRRVGQGLSADGPQAEPHCGSPLGLATANRSINTLMLRSHQRANKNIRASGSP